MKRSSKPFILIIFFTLTPLVTFGQSDSSDMSSLSIVGFDPHTGDVGIALASRFFAVAPIAAHVRADVGAVATMGGAPHSKGSTILDWLEEGLTPESALQRLQQAYPEGIGQINIVDVRGNSISTTNSNQARMWRGHKYGRHYAAAGNLLTGPEVVNAFAESFESTAAMGLPLAERLLEALEAADRMGGDARGRMGATLVVARKGGGLRGTDFLVNLRVDDSRNSIIELRELYMRWKDVHAQEPGFRIMEMSRGADVAWLQTSLKSLGFLTGDEATAFEKSGQSIGLYEDITADAVARYKRRYNLGRSTSAGLETVKSIIRQLKLGKDGELNWSDVLKNEVSQRADLGREEDLMSSLSIVGFDPKTGDIGNCMTSKYFAVGPIASFTRAGVGSITIMQRGPFPMGEQMLDWMEEENLTPVEVLQRLRTMMSDTGQINIVDSKGRSISTTGPQGRPWQGQRYGTNYATSGNILAGPAVVNAFAEVFEKTESSELPLAERLLQACEAAYLVGGDARGQQAAQLKVYRQGAGFRGTDLLVDLRVDDSPQAIPRLRRLWEEWKFHHLYGVGFQPIEQTSGNDVRELQHYLLQLGFLKANDKEVFSEGGEARGIFNDSTAKATQRWKQSVGLDRGAYLVQFMLQKLKQQGGQSQ